MRLTLRRTLAIAFVLLSACGPRKSHRSNGACSADRKADRIPRHARAANVQLVLAADRREHGLTPDRWPTKSFSSVAAIGFALTAYPIGVERGYMTRASGRAIAR